MSNELLLGKSNHAFLPMSKETELELNACITKIETSIIDESLSLKAKKAIPENVEFYEAHLHLKAGQIGIAYSFRSFQCSPGVWFQTVLLQLLGKSQSR